MPLTPVGLAEHRSTGSTEHGVEVREEREASLEPLAGWMEELAKHETTQEGIHPRDPHLWKPVPSVQAHLTFGVLRILFSPPRRPDRSDQ